MEATPFLESLLEDIGSEEAGPSMPALPPEQLQQQGSPAAPERAREAGAAPQPEHAAAPAPGAQQAQPTQAQLMQQMQATQAQAYTALVAAPLAAGGAQPIPVAARPDGSYSFGPQTAAPGAVLGMPLALGGALPGPGVAGPAYTFSSAAPLLPPPPPHGMLGLSQVGAFFRLTFKLQPVVSAGCGGLLGCDTVGTAASAQRTGSAAC